MQKKIVSLFAPILICIVALAFGWFAHAAVPTAAQGIVMGGHATLSDPLTPSAPAGTKARLTYQGRLTNVSGAPINAPVSVGFKLYDQARGLLWTSATRSITPVNGLFTIYLGDGADPDLDYTTLRQTASIGVTIGGDLEMTPRQALNTIIGHSDTTIGVLGTSNIGDGVVGTSNTGYGVAGSSNSSDGVFGYTDAVTRAGVLAFNAYSSGIALEIPNGGIKATGAGVGTATFAFIHVSTDTNNISNSTFIDNVLTNGDPNAMLFVTHVYNPAGVSSKQLFNLAFGMNYDSRLSQWSIYREDAGVMPAGVSFNVMVIKR